MITQLDVQLLAEAALNAGLKIDQSKIELLTWNAGITTHIPLPLPEGYSAVYIFKHPDEYLKVGQACPNSAPRYLSHHYYTTAPSTLAKSLLKDPKYSPQIGTLLPRTWIIQNTIRFNILIPSIYNKHFVNFAEAFFILKCIPKFER